VYGKKMYRRRYGGSGDPHQFLDGKIRKATTEERVRQAGRIQVKEVTRAGMK
jgi:hypothetical protein